MSRIIIAIDGYSSTGKSTIAKALARELSFIYVDTGAMYRAVTLYALENQLIGEGFFKETELIKSLPHIQIGFELNTSSEQADVLLNGINVEKAIRTLRVSNYVSTIAAVSEVRKKLVEQQQQLGKTGGLVMDGRDIGTVVFPEANFKFFMTASAEVRAQRRYKELKDRGEQISYDEVLENVLKRDQLDSNRKDSPLRKAEDALEIDNSEMSIREQLSDMLKIIRKEG
jgi:cytidylate kinase